MIIFVETGHEAFRSGDSTGNLILDTWYMVQIDLLNN